MPTTFGTSINNAVKGLGIGIMNRDLFEPHPNDITIIIMGPTGSGKTNFINNLTGNAEKSKAANLQSATQGITAYPIQYHGLRLVLVDTPGFDDTFRPDFEILKMIADWLTKKYPDGDILRVTGIVYLHRITDNRVSGSVYKNLQMFGRLCGDVPLHRALLITTMWDVIKDENVARRRLTELKGDFWQQFLSAGAQVKEFKNTPNSAFGIVDDILKIEHGPDELLLQEELVRQEKRLNETEAGKVLYSRFQKLLAEQRNTLKGLADEAKMQNDPSLARSMQEEYERINSLLQKTLEDMKEMKVSLSRRILLWLFRRKTRARVVMLDEMPT